jgi:hypothetical protein
LEQSIIDLVGTNKKNKEVEENKDNKGVENFLIKIIMYFLLALETLNIMARKRISIR